MGPVFVSLYSLGWVVNGWDLHSMCMCMCVDIWIYVIYDLKGIFFLCLWIYAFNENHTPFVFLYFLAALGLWISWMFFQDGDLCCILLFCFGEGEALGNVWIVAVHRVYDSLEALNSFFPFFHFSDLHSTGFLLVLV